MSSSPQTSNPSKEASASLGTSYLFPSLVKNPFFTYITSGNTTQKELLKRFIPFYYAVEFWVKHLIKIRDLLDPVNAAILQENIDDELGVKGGERGKPHTETYMEFLSAIKGSPVLESDLFRHRSVDNFIKRLERKPLITTTDIIQALVILGGIELFYIDISNFFNKHLTPLLKGGQGHYKVHEVLDKKHSDDLFQIADNLSRAKNAHSDIMKYITIYGKIMGSDMLNDLYIELSY